MRRIFLLFACSCVPLLAQVAPQTTPAAPAQPVPRTSAISGVVIDAATGRPIAGAIVGIRQPGGPVGGGFESVGQQITDASGRFVFTRLKASNRTRIDASKDGYLSGGYRQDAPDGFAPDTILAAGQWLDVGKITLWPPAVITGTVTDERGEPAVGVYVKLLARLMIAGLPQLAASSVTTTDDRGVYRFPGVPRGQYLVAVPSVQQAIPTTSIAGDAAIGALEVTPGFRLLLGQYMTPHLVDGRLSVYPTTFHPSTRSLADATAIAVADGEEKSGIDIVWRPTPVVSVSGRVAGPPEAGTDILLRLLPKGSESLGNGSETATTLAGADGRFLFAGVPAGEYVIDATHALAEFTYYPRPIAGAASLPEAPGAGRGGVGLAIASAPVGTMLRTRTFGASQSYAGRQPITVGHTDVADVVITLTPGVTISGRVIRDAPLPAAALPRGLTSVSAEPADGNVALGMPQTRAVPAEGGDTFVLEGLRPGDYFLRVLFGTGTVASITWQGRDYTYRPFTITGGENIGDVTITLTQQTAKISGTVRDERNAPVERASIVVFPVDKARWSRYGFSPSSLGDQRAGAGGAYALSLRAGSVYVIAVAASEAEGWKDPAWLDAASRLATRVAADWGQTVTQDLVLRHVR